MPERDFLGNLFFGIKNHCLVVLELLNFDIDTIFIIAETNWVISTVNI